MLAPSEDELSFGWQCFRDVGASAGDTVVLRSNICSEDASEWVRRYSEATNTSWIVYNTKKANVKGWSVIRYGGAIFIPTTRYFSDGLTPAEAVRLHESTLAVDEDAASLVQLASGAVNPTKRTVYHLYEKWRQDNYGPVGDPFAN
ncbi:hypothetical protein MTO96_026591 [Rhipicephalus appendiculatus]